MLVKTAEGEILDIDEHCAMKSYLLSNLAASVAVTDPVEILLDTKTTETIRAFMGRDNHVLKRDYNPLEIHFSNETLSYFDATPTQEIIKICNGANYLEYPYLLEVCCKILALRLSQNSAKTRSEVLGEKRVTEEEMSLVVQDFDWASEHI